MSGPVNNPFSSRKKAIAFGNQVAPGTPLALTSADIIDVAECSYQPQARTTEDPRYTGTIHRPGDILLGSSWDISFRWIIHGWGAGAVPAADAFLPGRVLKSWGFTENVFSTALGPEAFSAGTTTGMTLGATAVGTTGLYKGMAVNVDAIAAAPGGLAMIKDYTAGKVATLARTRAGAPATGNYKIPAQLAYTLSTTEPPNPSSITVWEGDNGGSSHRLNFAEMRPTAASIELVTSSRDNTSGFCSLNATYSGTLVSEASEAMPTLTTVNAVPVPPFRDGQQDIANSQLGGSSVTIDLGISSAFPPNPNQLDGSDPGLVVGTKRTASFELNKVRQSVLDFNALATAQAQHPAQFLWGLSSGNYIGVMIDAMRFNYRASQEGSDFISTTGDAWIDGVDKAVALSFIKYA